VSFTAAMLGKQSVWMLVMMTTSVFE